MKRNFLMSLFVGVLSMLASNVSAADQLSIEPFSIGPGQKVTVKLVLTNTSTNIQSIKCRFVLPESVNIPGVDRSKNYVIPESDFVRNTDRISATDKISFGFRKSDASYSLTANLTSGVQGTDGWIIAFDVELADGAPAQTVTVTWAGCQINAGGTVQNVTPDAFDVTTSDKFIAPCNADGYCTICPTVGLDLSGVDAYIVTGAAGESVTLKKITELAAGDAAVVKGSGDVEIPLKSGATTSESGNKLVGVQKYTDTSGKAEYFLVGAEFVKAAATSHLAAGRAYLAGLGSGAKVLNLSFDDDATAIQSVEAEQNNGVLYNLNGVRVDNAVKGVYIQNGRKVVIK